MCHGDRNTSAPAEPKLTLRAKLEAHKTDANCAACHRKIDPLGLAFDSYDAIGRWRTVELVSDGAGNNPAIDSSGALADGRKFADTEGLKKLMLADIDKFAGAFTEKARHLYALRRGMTFWRSGGDQAHHRGSQRKRLSARVDDRTSRHERTFPRNAENPSTS